MKRFTIPVKNLNLCLTGQKDDHTTYNASEFKLQWIFVKSFLSLDYPGNLVSKVITRVRSSSALKMIDPQKGPVYLKLSYLGNVSEKFS